MERIPEQYVLFHDGESNRRQRDKFIADKQRMRTYPSFHLCEQYLQVVADLNDKQELFFYGMELVRLVEGERDYLQIQLCMPIIKGLKTLYVPLVMHVYPYADSRPPKIILLPDTVYGINPDADYVVDGCVKTRYIYEWEDDPDFTANFVFLFNDLRYVFSSINPYMKNQILSFRLPNDSTTVFIDYDQLIGKGSYALVYAGKYKGMDVAVKECFIREKIRRKVEREIEINAQLDFKYIVKTYGYFKKYGSTYYVMERASSDLERELAKSIPTMESRKKMILTIAEALSYTLQRGIVHHDLKPDNILLVDGVYKLSDFGAGSIARHISDLTQTALISGNKMHQSLDVRVLQYSPVPKNYTELEKLQIQQYEDIYGLGILILDILLGFKYMTIYISEFQKNPEDYLYEVVVPDELNVDPEIKSIVTDCLKSYLFRPTIGEVYERLSVWCGKETPEILFHLLK